MDYEQGKGLCCSQTVTDTAPSDPDRQGNTLIISTLSKSTGLTVCVTKGNLKFTTVLTSYKWQTCVNVCWTCVEHEHAVHIHFCTIPSPYALLRLTVALCKEHSLVINLTPLINLSHCTDGLAKKYDVIQCWPIKYMQAHIPDGLLCTMNAVFLLLKYFPLS